MKKELIQKILNYGIPVLIFVLISYAYFPGLLEGKRIQGNDTKVSIAKSSEISQHREKYGEEPLWTNAQFGGMPAYFISVKYQHNLVRFVNYVMDVGKRPASYLIIAMLSFYILMVTFGMNPWLGMIAAIAFGFTTNSFVLLGAGHMSKVHTYAYMGGLIAGVILMFKGKQLWGFTLTGIFISLMLLSGHPQMTYYTMIIALIYGIVEFIDAIKHKTIPAFLKNVGLLLVAALLAFGSNFSRLYTQYEYMKYSTRGKTELTKPAGEKETQGLDHDYILHWSNSIAETFALMVPDYRGGGSDDFKEDTKFYRTIAPNLKQNFLKQGMSGKEATEQAGKQVGSLFYWGGKPSTAGPMYHGAIICFLFIFGLFVVKGKYKWWLAIATALSIMLSWGKYFPFLSHLFIDYFPFYDKFRDATMLMVIAQFTMPLLAALGLHRILQTDKIDKKKFLKALYLSFGLTGGLALIFAMIPSIAGDFTGSYDDQLPANLRDLLVADRMSVLRSDALRAFAFIAASAIIVWMFYFNKLKHSYLFGILAVLVLADLWMVGQRYLNNDDLIRPKKGIAYEATLADKEILKDKDPDYRVLNLSVSTFNDASTSNYHFSIGGYEGAKMRRFQELIDIGKPLSNDIQYIAQNLRTEQYDVFKNTPVLNMLNTKYVILNPNSAPLPNKYALGHAWFVNKVNMVPTADDEIKAMKTNDPANTAVVNEKYKAVLDGFNFKSDNTSTIRLIEYRANYLKYSVNTKTDQLAVFSEIYYPKGWNVYINGELKEHLGVNYILRALPVKAGSYEVEFKFEPKSYSIGNKVSFASSLILILLLIGVIGQSVYKRN